MSEKVFLIFVALAMVGFGLHMLTGYCLGWRVGVPMIVSAFGWPMVTLFIGYVVLR